MSRMLFDFRTAKTSGQSADQSKSVVTCPPCGTNFDARVQLVHHLSYSAPACLHGAEKKEWRSDEEARDKDKEDADFRRKSYLAAPVRCSRPRAHGTEIISILERATTLTIVVLTVIFPHTKEST